MSPILLTPHLQPMLWGGRKLGNYGFTLPEQGRIGEAWTLSMHPQGRSGIGDPRFAGMELYELWQQYPEWFGVPKDAEFPILVKWIDAQDDLSVQVHPDDKVASLLEGLPNGKTECWYIVSADEGASIILGHHCQSAAEFTQAIENGSLMDKLQCVAVKQGDFFFIPAGTVHALAKGCLVLEIQQNSNTTYRLYDYERRDKVTGEPRELHVEKGGIATHYPHRHWEELTPPGADSRYVLTHNRYFTVEKILMDNLLSLVTEASFQLFTVVSGQVDIEGKRYIRGATLLLPANGTYHFIGVAEIILVSLPQTSKESVRLGIDLGGTQLRVAAIDNKGMLRKQIKTKTANQNGVDAVLKNMVEICQTLQSEFQVIGVGVASPGPLSAAQGIIQSPPNLPGWDDIPLKDILMAALNCPVVVENDANAAAMGEAVFGAGRGMESLFYITVSTGIGGGFVFRNQLVSGANTCAGEIGNTIISDEIGMIHSALNSGALETLASGTALTLRAKELGLGHVVDLLRLPEERSRFVNYLAAGIANVIHTLDPHTVILGGGVMESSELFMAELSQAVNQRLYPQLRNKTPLTLAQLGTQAGVFGAAAILPFE